MTTAIIRGDARRLPLPDRSVDLVIGSPPYVKARTYLEDGKNLGVARDTREWVAWMLDVTAEALRVSRGLVLWVCAGSTKAWNYQPAPEGLIWEWWQQGGECHCLRPCYWHRVGIPGSGARAWYRGDVEYVLAFKRPGKLDYADPLANGHAPKYPPGGAMSNRTKGGNRVENEAGYSPPSLADPGNLLKTNAGGGHLAHPLAHENEAPYPVDVPAFFVRSHCPPGGTVLDPFAGSGTTLHAAAELGRSGIGVDLRQSQCRLAARRMRSVSPGFAFTEAPK